MAMAVIDKPMFPLNAPNSDITMSTCGKLTCFSYEFGFPVVFLAPISRNTAQQY